ncbi:unnamed protein product [Chrysoparadoxa australica]
MDTDHDARLSPTEFKQVVSLLQLEFSRVGLQKTFMESYFPRAYASKPFQCIKSIVESSWFDVAIDAVLVFNGVMVCLELLRTSEEDGSTFSTVELLLTLLYTIEMLLKIVVFGVRGYLSR